MDRYSIIKNSPEKQMLGKKGKYRIVKIYNRSFKTTSYQIQKKFLCFWNTVSDGNGEYSSYLNFKTPEDAEEFIKKGCPNPHGVDKEIIKHVEI